MRLYTHTVYDANIIARTEASLNGNIGFGKSKINNNVTLNEILKQLLS